MLKNQAFYERIFGMLLDIITIWGEERKSKGRPFHVLNEVIASSTLGILSWWLKEKRHTDLITWQSKFRCSLMVKNDHERRAAKTPLCSQVRKLAANLFKR